MEIEDLEIIDFFQLTLPLDSATPLQLESLIIKTQVAYRRKGHILTIKPDFLYLVRKGAVLINVRFHHVIPYFQKPHSETYQAF